MALRVTALHAPLHAEAVTPTLSPRQYRGYSRFLPRVTVPTPCPKSKPRSPSPPQSLPNR